MRIFTSITNAWFYSNVPPFIKVLSIFVKGDALVFVPFFMIVCGLVLAGALSLMSAALLLSITCAVRAGGEVQFWLMQQFGTKEYRPYDFGFAKLNNNAIYILYQVAATIQMSVWLTIATHVYRML